MRIADVINTFRDRIDSVAEMQGSTDFIVFGAGNGGKFAKAYLESQGKRVVFFCDNDPEKNGTFIGTAMVLAPEYLPEQDIPICIASDWANEIASQLKGMGIKRYFDMSAMLWHHGKKELENMSVRELMQNSRDDIEKAYGMFADKESRQVFLSIIKYRLTLDSAELANAPFKQYYSPHVSPVRGDVIIDGGAWVGDTAIGFARYLACQCKIFSFEPEKNNYDLLRENIAASGVEGAVEPVMAGLWSNGCYMRFNSDIKYGEGTQYHVDSEGSEKIEVVALDSFARERGICPTLIKMDIEGAEVKAIEGARETVAEHSPRLQIAVYHRTTDLWRIPLLIKGINPRYKFHLSHHSNNFSDTVLYACV